MPNRIKQKGTRFEYEIKHALEMLSFHVIRSYSSMGTADLVASPPWNPRKNSRALLIQAKNQKNADYVSPFERAHLDHLRQTNAGIVCIVYKDGPKVMVNHAGARLTFEVFIAKEYGIACRFAELVTRYRTFNRPIHLYPVDHEIYTGRDGTRREKPVAPFQDFYSVKPWYPYVPENHRPKELYNLAGEGIP